MKERYRLTEDGFDHTNLHSRRVETSECAPVVDNKPSAYHVGTPVHCTSLKRPSSCDKLVGV